MYCVWYVKCMCWLLYDFANLLTFYVFKPGHRMAYVIKHSTYNMYILTCSMFTSSHPRLTNLQQEEACNISKHTEKSSWTLIERSILNLEEPTVFKCIKVYVYFGNLNPGMHFNTPECRSRIICFWDNYNEFDWKWCLFCT